MTNMNLHGESEHVALSYLRQTKSTPDAQSVYEVSHVAEVAQSRLRPWWSTEMLPGNSH